MTQSTFAQGRNGCNSQMLSNLDKRTGEFDIVQFNVVLTKLQVLCDSQNEVRQ